MGVVILIIVGGAIVVGVIKGLISIKNEPTLDSDGTMHCKGCGGTSFIYWRNKDGSTTYECNFCGKRWTR